jgi:type II secretion system (T2SS) protein M
MAMTNRDRRALQIGGAALALWALLRFAVFPAWDSWEQARAGLPLQESALVKYRQSLASVGAERAATESLEKQLSAVEAGLLQSQTAALASAEFQDWIKQAAANHGIELHSSEFLALRPGGRGYAEVPLGLQFQCRVDQLVDFLSELRAGPKVVSIPRLQIQSGNGPEKLLTVSLTAAGIMRGPAGPIAAAR